MKYIFHVAMREFADNAKTKGFWIGLLLFPLMLWVGFQAPALLKKATPVRHFVLIDQSNNYEAAADLAFRRDYAKQRMLALKEYTKK